MKPVIVKIISNRPARIGQFHRPIFIVGLPRSGTSMVAGLMHEFGGWIGETVPATGENPKGFFENNELREQVLWPMLRAVGGDTAGVMKLPPLDVATRLKFPVDGQNVPMRLRMRQIIQEQGYSGENRWVYKAPKVTLLWRMFDQAFPDADWIIVRRKRAGFVKSCIKTSFMAQYSKDPEFWNTLADEYDARLDQLAASVKNVYTLQTEDILNGDTADLKSMVMKMDGLSFSIAKVRKFVDPKHWHHR